MRQMNRWFLGLIAVTVMQLGASAQKDSLPKLEDLKVPSSPAFTILGISPTSVERPSSARALGMTLVTAVEDGGAFEVAPYWWTDHPLTIDEYYNSTPWQTFLQTAAISAALTDLPKDAAGNTPAGSRVGAGFRFELLRGGRPAELQRHIKTIQQINADEAAELKETPEQEKAYAARRAEAVKKYKEADAQPTGWTLAVGAALAVDAPDGAASDVSRAGVWLTPAYAGTADSVTENMTFVGIGRYYHDDVVNEPDDKVDLGARLIWNIKDSPVSLSAEALHRFQAHGDDERYAAMIEYQLTEDLGVYFSYGTNFESNFESQQDVIVLFGINLGVGYGPRAPVPAGP